MTQKLKLNFDLHSVALIQTFLFIISNIQYSYSRIFKHWAQIVSKLHINSYPTVRCLLKVIDVCTWRCVGVYFTNWYDYKPFIFSIRAFLFSFVSKVSLQTFCTIYWKLMIKPMVDTVCKHVYTVIYTGVHCSVNVFTKWVWPHYWSGKL